MALPPAVVEKLTVATVSVTDTEEIVVVPVGIPAVVKVTALEAGPEPITFTALK